MPIYEYRCEANNTTLEVSHAMSDSVSTWGELCQRTGHAVGSTPEDSPVEKVVSVPIARSSAYASKSEGPGPCGSSCGCF